MHDSNLRWLCLDTGVLAGDMPAFVPRHFSTLLLIFLADAQQVLLVPSGDIRTIVERPKVYHIGMRKILLIRYGHEYLLCILIIILTVGSAIHLTRKEIAKRGVTLLKFLIKPISISHAQKSMPIIIFIIEACVLFELARDSQQVVSLLVFERLAFILIMDNGKDFNREVLMKNILNQKWPHPHNVFYVGLFKESETGLMYNDRMLVVQDRTFAIFYTKCFKPLPLLLQMEKKGGNPIKERLPVLSTTLYKQQNTITLRFLGSQGEPKSWVFKFITTELADKWMLLYHDIFQKCANKSLKSKESKSTNFSIEYSSILSNLKHSNPPPQAEEEYSNYTQIKKKLNVPKIEDSFSH